MPIRFPKHHIAKSVVNQILNVADGLPRNGSQDDPVAPIPNVPSTAEQSVGLDERLSTPISEPLPGIDEAPDPGATLNGDRLLDTVLEPGR